MPAISQFTTDYVIQRLEDRINGFNYWVQTLAGDGGYQHIVPFQLGTSHPANLINASVDEATIDSATLFARYPACVVRATGGNANQLRMTSTAYSGPIIIWVDLYSSVLKKNVYSGLSERYHDLFLDCMIETFDESASFTGIPGGMGFNNDIAWSRGPLAEGGVDFRQKSRFVLTFQLPMIEGRQ